MNTIDVLATRIAELAQERAQLVEVIKNQQAQINKLSAESEVDVVREEADSDDG